MESLCLDTAPRVLADAKAAYNIITDFPENYQKLSEFLKEAIEYKLSPEDIKPTP